MSTKISEVAYSSSLLGLGAISYSGGRIIANDLKLSPLSENVEYRALRMKKPAFAKIVKSYPSIMKTAGAFGILLGGAGLAYSIFSKND